MQNLLGKVTVVTGASRGIGKGVALGLGEAGATVYVTGRTVEPLADLEGAFQQTADEVTNAGGKGIAVRCDHCNDEEVADLFSRVNTEQQRLDILVNSVWGGYEMMFENNEFTWGNPFGRSPFRAGTRCSTRGFARAMWQAGTLRVSWFLNAAGSSSTFLRMRDAST